MTPTPYVTSTNACKLCTPLGACLAFHGIENAISLLHGSQGCSTYIRRYLISHFKEPLDIASTNFSEESAVYGGRENLKKALYNLTKQYNPGLIGVATTCLAETIGDDINLFLKEIRAEVGSEVLPPIVSVSTASYKGTHADGFLGVGRSLAQQVAKGGEPQDHINIFSPMMSPEDLRHLKEIAGDFGLKHALIPDYSETLDGGSWKEYQAIPSGGTSMDQLVRMGRAKASIEFGFSGVMRETGGRDLMDRFAVALETLPLPMGIRGTDRLMDTLANLSGKAVPEKYSKERQRLADAYADGHKTIFDKRAVVYGEEDLVLGICSFLAEIGIVPILTASGAKTGVMEKALKGLFPNFEELGMVCLQGADFRFIEERARELSPDLVIGHSKGFKMAQGLKVPLVRLGFPIHDRIGGQRLKHLGYRGTQALFDSIVNALLEKSQNDNPVGYTYL